VRNGIEFLSFVDICATCSYFLRVDKMIQLRHLSDELHCKLKARAAVEGLFLSDYLLRQVRRIAERPTVNELAARLGRRALVAARESPARVVRAERDAR